MKEDILILVDKNDNEIGYNEKMNVHIKGQLHRAFSLFIYDNNKKRVLLHRRALEKYHSGGLWTNSCCSHPRKGEQLLDAVIRRSAEELGINIKQYKKCIIEIGKFHYYKKFENCVEHEIDHVFVLTVNQEFLIKPNPNEIDDIKWISVKDLDVWISNECEIFTSWFSEAYGIFCDYINQIDDDNNV